MTGGGLMITMCWGAKGGSGTTVVAATLALAHDHPTVLVDLDGDVPAALGIAEPDGPGLFDWMRSDAPASRLGALEIRARGQVTVLPRGHAARAEPDRWPELLAWMRGEARRIVIDAGSACDPPPDLARVADHALLVTRPCYLALRAAARSRSKPTGIVLVDEPGRALRAHDLEASLGVPVVATVLVDPAVARAVDAGLLIAHLPAGFRRAMQLAA
jgi:hypothetical protein